MASVTAAANSENRTSSWLDWVDRQCVTWGDRLNPLLVKETRQALKSRQFVVTFSVLLFAALGWTIVGSLMLMPDIYTTPSAPRLLIGYYVVLAIPLLLVVPLAAYRSLEGEIDDGTLELLSITSLSPWQIVLGKLASAGLQMLLYFVALFPCVAYAYTLRGVDLPTTLLMVLVLFVSATLLTVVGLFFAPLGRTRTSRIMTMLGLFGLLGISEYLVGALVISMIWYGNPLPLSWTLFFVVSGCLLAVSLSVFFLCVTAAQLTPESENRSTPIRLALLLVSLTTIGTAAYGILALNEVSRGFSMGIATIAFLVLIGLWTFCGCMFCSESSAMTPRIQRELPSSFLSRLLLTWLTPGPATGLVFSVLSMVVMCVLVIVGLDLLRDNYPGAMPGYGAGDRARIVQLMTLYVSYVTCFFVAVRWLIAIVRIKHNPRAEIGVAAFIAVAVFAALVPYSIELHFNDYRDFAYSPFQLSNWAWTLSKSISRAGLTGGEEHTVACAGFCMFIGTLLTMPATVLPRRIATPERVLQERESAKA